MTRPPGRPLVRRRVALLALPLGLLVWAAGALVLRTCEPYIHQVSVTPHGEALTNPLLAAQLLLTRLGYPARVVRGEIDLPPAGQVLVMLHRTAAFASLRQANLLRWVAAGGRLVVTPSEDDETGKPDALLAALGVQAAPGPSNTNRRGLVHLPLPPVKAMAMVVASRHLHLIDTRHAASHALGDASGAFLLILPYGKGDVTVVSDASFFEGFWIGQYDNAALVVWLVLGRTEPAGVVLSFEDEMPSLAALLGRHAWTLVLPALLLAGAGAWRAAARFGPLAPDPPDERRSLLEHLDAAGRWLWQGDRGMDRRALMDAVRRAVAARVEARQPAWSKLPGPELIENLAAAAGLAPQEVAQALHGPAIRDEAQFVATVRTLAQVRRAL
jgi:hypothetical protein